MEINISGETATINERKIGFSFILLFGIATGFNYLLAWNLQYTTLFFYCMIPFSVLTGLGIYGQVIEQKRAREGEYE